VPDSAADALLAGLHYCMGSQRARFEDTAVLWLGMDTGLAAMHGLFWKQ
jgi:hypothetical protein